jgi:hypothetical protein
MVFRPQKCFVDLPYGRAVVLDNSVINRVPKEKDALLFRGS